MSLLVRLLVGFFVIAAGVLMFWRTQGVMSWVGQIPWAEDKFGSGGTYLFLRLLALIVIFVGMAIATDLAGGMVLWFANLFGLVRQPV
jgi:hypothetical protein